MAIFPNSLVDIDLATFDSKAQADLTTLRDYIKWFDERYGAWSQITSLMMTAAPPNGLGLTTTQSNFMLAFINDLHNFSLLAHGSAPVNIDDATFNIKNLILLG